MDNQDKIFDKFKDAAQNSEQKDFPGMDKVWARVEDKLDKKEDKKAISLWKKIAIAASLLLLISIGSQFLKSDKTTAIPASKVVVNEKDSDDKSILEKNDAVVSSESPIISKNEAVKILDKQIKQQQEVAMNYDSITVYEPVGAGTAAAMNAPVEVAAAAPIQPTYAEEDNLIAKEKVNQDSGYLKTMERKSAKLAFADKQIQTAKKSAPLIVLNGSALSHSDDKKRDQMMQDEMPNFQPENLDSLVVLDAPLYIIDGNYYSENDLFGKSPTSPYAPLNKQEIKTITVLQDLEATSKYGEKGKKGVVIITTKYGKPTPKN
ncbi:hypothetical protein ACHRVZ_18785 [Flavobacterium sp. FlaQc-57]|uniref:hypothetical protein n=1 Tax=Flavobacterium sp. FlaQc-57 TaxID=3374186 RepID=UPI003757E689